MKEITKKVREEAMSKISSLINELANEGKDSKYISSVAHDYIKSKIRSYYASLKGPRPIGEALSEWADLADSKAEMVLYVAFIDAGLEFKFQYGIGRYRVDFFFEPDLVVELDGPHHGQQQKYDEIREAYLKKMGYKIFRVPIWILSIDTQAVIDEIKEQQYGDG